MTKAEKIERLWGAFEALSAMEYEAVGYDPNQLRSDIRNHPRRAELEEIIEARNSVWVVLCRLERQTEPQEQK